jgi:alkanesulfonate monooxygenase SsuD/methylene tetrahydromethanopterin reductase-like flavin-dependent oxidoreductase (luciferase family)
MADFDIGPRGPLRVGIALADHVWLDSPGVVARVRAVDLRDLVHKAADAHAEQPGVDVLVDIDVMIAHVAQSARDAMDAISREYTGGTLLYVGTPTGLAGLIADIHALGIADGAVLSPMASASESDPVLQLIRNEVLPVLHTMSAPRSVTRESRSA